MNIQRLYTSTSLVLACIFGSVGLIFLLLPGAVVEMFNNVSNMIGMAEAPAAGSDFYRILAVGYMYVVTLLAFCMYRQPGNDHFPLLLINAKAASSILSLLFFVCSHSYLIFLANALVDGTIAVGIFMLWTKVKKERQ